MIVVKISGEKNLIRFVILMVMLNAKILSILLLLLTTLNIVIFITENVPLYTEKFNPDYYRDLWGQSQYVSTSPTQMLPDEIVYSFVAWEYLHGVNPAVFNADQPPLGKYFIGVSEIWFGNPKIVGPVFNIVCLVALYFLAQLILKNYLWSISLVTLFSFEKIFIAQMKYAPLLDNIQLFFILLSFIFFVKFSQDVKLNRFLVLSFLSLGAVAVSKFWITAFVVYIIWLLYIFAMKNREAAVKFIIISPAILITMLMAYTPAFLHGLTLSGFLGVQKYMYSFHQGKLDFDPLSVWDLLLFNRWHSFSGIRPSVDWQISWPIVTTLSLLAIILAVKKKFMVLPIGLIMVWCIVYFVLLTGSSILSRYLIPVLPAMYILSFWVIKTSFSSATK